MDIKNWLWDALGQPVVGVDVYVYDATDTFANGNSLISSTQTNTDGMFSFTGLTESPKDIKVVVDGVASWYKGNAKLGLSGLSIGGYPVRSPDAPGLIINGNYDHWQRVAGNAQTCTTTFNILTSFGPDRMYTLPVGASVSVQRSTTNLPANGYSRYNCAITGAGSVTTVDHGQRIHSQHQHRYKQPLVFMAVIRNETGSAFTPNLRIDTPAAADDWTTPTNRLDTALQSCPDSASTLVWAILNPSAYTNIANGMSVYLRFPSGSLTAGKIIRVSQFDLGLGTVVQPYIPPDSELELRRALAYYLKTFPQGTAPAQNSGVQTGNLYVVTQVAGTAGANAAPWHFPVVMVKAPTIVTYNPLAANAAWRNLSTAADSGVASTVAIADRGCVIFQTQVAGDIVQSACIIHATANAELV